MAMYFFLRLEICENARVARTAFLAPDRPISQCLPYSLQDQDLFRCNVPRPADWLRAYRACQTASSFDALTCFGHARGSQKQRLMIGKML